MAQNKQKFLEMVASDLKNRYATDMSKVVVVFPNKRASLFLNDFLCRDGQTIWAPQYRSIDELFGDWSEETKNDEIDSVCRIYHIYKEICGGKEIESLDSFYGWGERILEDFDDLDKNLGNAQQIFSNVSDWKSIDFGAEVEEEARKTLLQFLGYGEQAEQTQIREKFFALWNQLFPIYQQLNDSLREDGLAYEGALFRRVLERLQNGEIALDDRTYHFVGFNALSRVETELFKFLKDQEKAVFYWDYDEFYKNDERSEAGQFVRENLKLFPNALTDANQFNQLTKPKEIEFIATKTENGQANYAATWLQKDDNLTADPKDTAIVLCNEGLIEPILYALPENVGTVNITKGFPLAHTAAYQLAYDFFENERKHEKKTEPLTSEEMQQLLGRLQSRIADEAKKLRSKTYSQASFANITAEAYFQVYRIGERFLRLAATNYFSVSRLTLRKLFLQVVRTRAIPFSGEPAEGLQIMGLLETRNLDFRHVLILSANEGFLPQRPREQSFIPYAIKRHFGLTDAKKRTDVFAFYFFRLLQRAEKITILYNTSAGQQSGEMSRYLLQMLQAKQFDIKHRALIFHHKPVESEPESFSKPEKLYDKIQESGLSPSSLNQFIDCELRFYFSRVLRFRKPDDMPDAMPANRFGTLFHDAAFLYYDKEGLVGKPSGELKAHNLGVLNEKDNATLHKYVSKAFEQNHVAANIYVQEVLVQYMRRLLQYDNATKDLRLEKIESDHKAACAVEISGTSKPAKMTGRIDRIDTHTTDDETWLRVFDYKTGQRSSGPAAKIKTPKDGNPMDGIIRWGDNAGQHANYFFETFYYANLLLCEGEERQLETALFYPQDAVKPDEYKPSMTPSFANCGDEFRERLQEMLNYLFDISEEFKPTPDAQRENVCTYCDFRTICYGKEFIS